MAELSQLPNTLQEETEDHPKVIKHDKSTDKYSTKYTGFSGGAKAETWRDDGSSDTHCKMCKAFIPIPSLMPNMVVKEDGTIAFITHTDSALQQAIGAKLVNLASDLDTERAITVCVYCAGEHWKPEAGEHMRKPGKGEENTFINPDTGAPTPPMASPHASEQMRPRFQRACQTATTSL